jgi:hypothetical protein
MSAEDQQEYEEYKMQLIEEVEAKYLANFKVDWHQNVVRQNKCDVSSL